jgi:hypothetical protein
VRTACRSAGVSPASDVESDLGRVTEAHAVKVRLPERRRLALPLPHKSLLACVRRPGVERFLRCLRNRTEGNEDNEGSIPSAVTELRD